MSEYFDEDFFKFLLGFVAIICISLILILVTRISASEPGSFLNENLSAKNP